MKIIITGSLGHISKPLAQQLVNEGHQVTVVSSSADRQKDIEAIGAAAAIGSVEDIDFLASIFTGADAVYAMIPPNYTALDPIAYYRNVGNSYAKAIQKSGIKRVVHLSSYGAHLDSGTGFILGSHYVEGILNALPNINLTHLRPTYFYYNLKHFIGIIKQSGIIGSNYGGDDRIVMVSPLDIATVATEELAAANSTNRIRYIASDVATGDEIANVLGAAIGKPDLKWVVFTNDQTQSSMEQNGMPANIAALMVQLGAAIHSGKLLGDYEQQQPISLGKVKLQDFAKEFAVTFGN